MKHITTTIATLALALSLAACGASTGTDGTDRDALPQGSASSAPETSAPAETAEAAPKASTCDLAREAILTGTDKEIKAAMKALVKDKKADATARESAQDYLDEKDAELKDMYADLVQMACSI